MRKSIFWLMLFALGSLPPWTLATNRTVRVAAIQCPSRMGAVAENTNNITALVRQAAGQGAKIVVTPECAVQGYMDPVAMVSWAKSPNQGAPSASEVAEPVPGPNTRHFAALAKELGVYLCIGLIETASNRFYNAQVLLSPSGEIVGHHRKKALWAPGDATWVSQGDRPTQVVDTEFGRLGLMICYDYNVMPPKLKERGADIVLYSIGWYGPNEKSWFTKRFPREYVIPNGFAVIAANWSASDTNSLWPGAGYSCIIARDGAVLAATESAVGNTIVIADAPVGTNRVSVGKKETAKMRQGIAIWNFGWAAQPTMDFIAKSARLGFDTVALHPLQLLAMQPAEREQVAECTRTNGVDVTLHGDCKLTREQITTLTHLFDKRLRCFTVDLALDADSRPNTNDLHTLPEVLSWIAEETRGTDCRFGAEDFPLDADGLASLAALAPDLVRDPRFGILIDLGHMNLRLTRGGRFAGVSPAEYLRRIPTPIVEIHVHDNNGKADEHRHPGQGTVAFAEVAQALHTTGFKGVTTIDVAPSLHKGDPAAEWDFMPATSAKWKSLTEDGAGLPTTTTPR